MVKYRRNLCLGGIYFFTVTLADRKSNLLIEYIHLLKNAIKLTKEIHPFKIIAIVILPNHLHTIWQLPANDANYSLRWQKIKSYFTKSLRQSGMKISRDNKGEYKIWQPRFWEHTIKDESDLENHINYIHYNPIKHGLVKRVFDWPYSSFHYYVAQGILSVEWYGEANKLNKVKFAE